MLELDHQRAMHERERELHQQVMEAKEEMETTIQQQRQEVMQERSLVDQQERQVQALKQVLWIQCILDFCMVWGLELKGNDMQYRNYGLHVQTCGEMKVEAVQGLGTGWMEFSWIEIQFYASTR